MLLLLLLLLRNLKLPFICNILWYTSGHKLVQIYKLNIKLFRHVLNLLHCGWCVVFQFVNKSRTFRSFKCLCKFCSHKIASDITDILYSLRCLENENSQLPSSDEVHPCQSERFSLCCFWQKSSDSASQASHYPQWRKTPETSNTLHLRPNIWGSIFSHPHPINTTVIGNHSLTWSRVSRACITSIAPSSSI